MIHKKTPLFFAGQIMASFFSLSSCDDKTVYGTKIPTRKSEGLTNYVRLTSKAQLDQICRYDSAIILVDKIGCQYCRAAKEGLKRFIEKTHDIIYVVDLNDVYLEALNSSDNRTGDWAYLYGAVTGTPTFLFYSNGRCMDSYDKGVTAEEIEDMLNHYIEDVNLYSLNDFHPHKDELRDEEYFLQDIDEEQDWLGYQTETLDNRLAQGNLTVLYTWRRCDDCRQLHMDFLDQWQADNPERKLYYYELDGYFQRKRSTDETLAISGMKSWSDFSGKYHLNDYRGNIDSQGNAHGVTPTLVRYFEDGTYQVGVYRNSSNVYININRHLAFGHAFYDDVKSLESKTRVKEDNPNAEDYQKALRELESRAEVKEQAHLRDLLDA